MTYTPTRIIENYQTLSVLNTSEKNISTSILIYDSTEVEYTPASTAQYVVYSVSINSECKPDLSTSFANTRLQQSTDSGLTWTDIDGCKLFEGTDSHEDDGVRTNNAYTFILSAWTGAKKLRLAGRAKNADSEYRINCQYQFNANQGESAPMISIYSVTETN